MPRLEPLGVFGGTFDPVHSGHLRLAEEARKGLALEGVRWIPAGQPPHRDRPGVGAVHRLAMVRLAVTGNPAFSVDASEVEAERPSYTVPTLERLRDELGRERPLVLLLGADAFGGLPTWHRWTTLFELAHVAVSHRPGYPVEPDGLPPALAEVFARRRLASPDGLGQAPGGGIVTFAMTQLAISATQIRGIVARGASPRYLLPDALVDYIQRHHLYQSA